MGTRVELEIRDAQGGLRRESIREIGTTSVGRASDCDLVIANASVSGRHAELRLNDGRLEARDLASSWGTFVGSTRVTDWCSVPSGESLWIGDIELVPRYADATSSCLVRLRGPSAEVCLSVGGGTSDRIGAAEAPPSSFPELAGMLPLTFRRERGRVVGVVDNAGTAYPFPALVGGVHIEEVELDDSMASVAVVRGPTESALDSPAADPEPPAGRPQHSAAGPRAGTGRPESTAETGGRRSFTIRYALIGIAAAGATISAAVLWLLR